VLDQILVMLHPFMPFITEELWHAMPALSGVEGGERPYDLILAKWPMPDARALDPEATKSVERLIKAVTEIRSARTELGINPALKLHCWALPRTPQAELWLSMTEAQLQRLARLEKLKRPQVLLSDEKPAGRPLHPDVPDGARIEVDVADLSLIIPLEGVIDIEAERARLSKALQQAEKERDSLAGRLSNPSFVERAKPEAVEKARSDHAEKASDAEKYRAALSRLG
jgi:valyl-tRNA synthetase